MSASTAGPPPVEKLVASLADADENSAEQSRDSSLTGMLIVNADDFGRTQKTTDNIAACIGCGSVSSTSAMVFMEDSERAASLARDRGIDCGLHLNLTTRFSSSNCPPRLIEYQGQIASFLRSNRLAPAFFHPGLARHFEYAVRAQFDEFERLYGAPAGRVDGHHHMHLCANVQFQKLLPIGTIARRNFSFGPKEKPAPVRFYRRWQDRRLAKRHRMTDLFYSLAPINPPARLLEILAQATQASVEVETHPVNNDEYEFLAGGALMHMAGRIGIARGYKLP